MENIKKQIILDFINWNNDKYPESYIPNSKLGLYLQQKENNIKEIDIIMFLNCLSEYWNITDKEIIDKASNGLVELDTKEIIFEMNLSKSIIDEIKKKLLIT